MQKHDIPHVGLRTIKTALAVMVCVAVFLPFHMLQDDPSDPWSMVGPLNACVAAIICMQSSIEDSWQQGFIRLRGTAIGGVVGILMLTIYLFFPYPVLLIPMLGASTVLVIWWAPRTATILSEDSRRRASLLGALERERAHREELLSDLAAARRRVEELEREAAADNDAPKRGEKRNEAPSCSPLPTRQ